MRRAPKVGGAGLLLAKLVVGMQCTLTFQAFSRHVFQLLNQDILLEAIHEQGRADACASHGEERHERTWLHGASCKGTRQVGVNTNVVATWSLHTHPVGPSTVANAIDGVITTVAIAGAIQSCTHRICFGTLLALCSAPLPCSENGRVRACESKRRHGGGGRRR